MEPWIAIDHRKTVPFWTNACQMFDWFPMLLHFLIDALCMLPPSLLWLIAVLIVGCTPPNSGSLLEPSNQIVNCWCSPIWQYTRLVVVFCFCSMAVCLLPQISPTSFHPLVSLEWFQIYLRLTVDGSGVTVLPLISLFCILRGQSGKKRRNYGQNYHFYKASQRELESSGV